MILENFTLSLKLSFDIIKYSTTTTTKLTFVQTIFFLRTNYLIFVYYLVEQKFKSLFEKKEERSLRLKLFTINCNSFNRNLLDFVSFYDGF